MVANDAEFKSVPLNNPHPGLFSPLTVDSNKQQLPRRNEARLFLRHFTKELVREISLRTKVLTLLLATLFIAASAYWFVSAGKTEQRAVASIEANNRKLSELDNQLAQLTERLKQANQQLANTAKSDPVLKGSLGQPNVAKAAAPPTLWTAYSNGVCLIAGSYILTEPDTGRPLRYSDLEQKPDERLLSADTEMPLTFEGTGKIFEMEFEGTGFHVGSGFIVTNRHIASNPWIADERGQYFIARTGGKPRLHRLLAFFPGQSEPFPMKLKAASPKDDVAICKLDTARPTSGIPNLPLDQQSADVAVGKPVVMMGYPTGPFRLLALLPRQEALKVMDKHGESLPVLLEQLATRKLIRPLTTQGHISDLYENRIVFDAATSDGSSGTPMFGESGKVIGVTFAIFVDEGASNFAVGINSTNELLRKLGWKANDN